MMREVMIVHESTMRCPVAAEDLASLHRRIGEVGYSTSRIFEWPVRPFALLFPMGCFLPHQKCFDFAMKFIIGRLQWPQIRSNY